MNSSTLSVAVGVGVFGFDLKSNLVLAIKEQNSLTLFDGLDELYIGLYLTRRIISEKSFQPYTIR